MDFKFLYWMTVNKYGLLFVHQIANLIQWLFISLCAVKHLHNHCILCVLCFVFSEELNWISKMIICSHGTRDVWLVQLTPMQINWVTNFNIPTVFIILHCSPKFHESLFYSGIKSILMVNHLLAWTNNSKYILNSLSFIA